jgi:hypothetical protein
MAYASIPLQPKPIVSYLRVGRLLYYSLALFVLESWIYWVELKEAYNEGSLIWTGFWIWSFGFSFIHIFLVLADGWSRYQNYKRAKDHFFAHGFNPRIADMYLVSKCQRMAAEVAAEELGIVEDIRLHYAKKGVKWYHYIPYFMVEDPLFFLSRDFWSRTFLEKNYKPRFDYRSIQMELSS